MAIKVPNVGKLWILNLFRADFNGYSIRLFQNDLTPGNLTVLGDITEANFSGYVSKTLANSTPAVIDVSNKALTIWDPLLWSHNGGATANSIYGYYVLDGTGGLVYIERDPSAPVSMSMLGSTYVVNPRLTVDSEF